MLNLKTCPHTIPISYAQGTLRKSLVLFYLIMLTACGSNTLIKPEVKANTVPAPTSQTPSSTTSLKPGSGGYYLDDGPGDNPPADLDGIPDAVLKDEMPQERANKPYIALGQQYIPMTSYIPYKKQGIASWYGKRYHGKKTSTGEIYDMYAMSAAHTILPIPSYAKVTNPANGRTVIVRINDRGPFKHDRLIDLSYAAAYKLRLIGQGSGLVEVETIDTRSAGIPVKTGVASNTKINAVENESPANPTLQSPIEEEPTITPQNKISAENNTAAVVKAEYFVQAGAFKNEANGAVLQKKIQGLLLAENVSVANVYNDGLYRVKLGPYASKKEADTSANNIRKQLNITAIVQNQ